MPSDADVDIVVWQVRPPELPDTAHLLLDADESRRVARMLRPTDRARGTATRALTRAVLAATLHVPPHELVFERSCAWCGGPHGKPRLAGGGPSFSLSHSGMVVLLAVAESAGVEVGVDVEVLEPGRIGPGARSSLHAADEPLPDRMDDDALLTTWVRKEAALKTTGEGLAVPMSRLVTDGAHRPARLRAWLDEDGTGRDLHVGMCDLQLGPALVGCVAALGGQPRPQLRDGAPLVAAAADSPERPPAFT